LYNDVELASVASFASQQHALLSTLPSKHSPSSIVHATACYAHHISETEGFFNVKNSLGVSQAEALKTLLMGGLGEKWIDNVPEEFSCCCV